MIIINKDNNEQSIICTLTEKTTITQAFYLFVFDSVVIGRTYKFIKSVNDDESIYPNRYNEFIIDASVIFANAPLGQYQYKVYQQDNGTNEDIAGLPIVEQGKAILKETETPVYSGLDVETQYKGYGG